MHAPLTLPLVLIVTFAGLGPAMALEGGASGYPMGAENYSVGVVPDPGTYLLNYSLFYSANRFNGANGQKLYPFHATLAVEAPRIVHAFDTTILGGTPIFAVMLAGGVESVSLYDGGTRGTGGSVFETITTQGLGWHLSPTMHLLVAIDEFIPVGSYAADRTINLSTNRFAAQPIVAFTYDDPEGLNFSIKAMYDLPSYNPATRYRSGSDFHFDYAVGYNIDKWTLGVGGYFEHQVGNDRQYGAIVDGTGFKAQGFAVGPNIQYTFDDNVIRFKWQREIIAQNKSQGDMFWFTGVFPFESK